MRILLISTAFNSLTQRIFCELKELGHLVSVQFAYSDEAMLLAVDTFSPEIIICPYLSRYVPMAIFEKIPTFIVHPGIRGDKGAFSLDHAVLDEKERWGVSIIKANSEFDGGDIWASEDFMMRQTKKASLYRREVNMAASKAILDLIKTYNDNSTDIIKQLATPKHASLTQQERAIDWPRDTTDTIITKINAADSLPGVKDTLLGIECYLFGAHKEDLSHDKKMQETSNQVETKEIFAKRDGAVCIKTIDGALWVSHLKAKGRFKLPATYVLKERLQGVKEFRIPLYLEAKRETFYEIRVDRRGDIAYLYFDFHNGAFSAEQSIRLKYAIETLKEECKVLVLMGGEEFFSNGIHLNILEDSKKAGEDGWSNINAMNDMVRSTLLADDILTVAAIRGGTGAGGLFLGLACDYVVAREGVVLNPHCKTIGLSGSEFHTYTLPNRVGEEKASQLLDEALPISVKEAKSIGLVDEVFSEAWELFDVELHQFAEALVRDEEACYDLLEAKRERLEEDAESIAGLHKRELERMHPEFWEASSSFHQLRRVFVYKECSTTTPERLIYA